MYKIRIKGKNYNVKYSIRAIFLWEQMTGRKFSVETTLDNYVFFYAMILANNPDNVLEWDDFLDAMDTDTKLITQLAGIVESYNKKQNLFDSKEDTEKKSTIGK